MSASAAKPDRRRGILRFRNFQDSRIHIQESRELLNQYLRVTL